MIYNTLGNDLQQTFKIMFAICSNFVQLFDQFLTITNQIKTHTHYEYYRQYLQRVDKL